MSILEAPAPPPLAPAISGGKGGYTVRPGTSDDANFIFATWLRCYKHSSQFARRIPDRLFYAHHQAAIARILERGASVRVAHPIAAPETILGYLVTEPSVIHFVYVKKAFRRAGIARALLSPLDPNACVYTHSTHDWEHLHALWPDAEYNPYLI